MYINVYFVMDKLFDNFKTPQFSVSHNLLHLLLDRSIMQRGKEKKVHVFTGGWGSRTIFGSADMMKSPFFTFISFA